jgi:phenylpyruvate tautomerase PptA (4-oxalocrotonate tautomerase family)
MPYLKLNTNKTVSKDKSAQLLNQLSQAVAKATGKPERYIMIELNDGKTLLFAGNSEPSAFIECKSIGLTTTQSKSLSSSLCQLLEMALQIKPDRIYIEFVDCPAEFWGWNGTTFG